MTKKIPDIHELVRRHMEGSHAQRKKIEADAIREDAKKLARQVAKKGLKLAKEGKRAEAEKALAEATALELEWRKLGGKGPLT